MATFGHHHPNFDPIKLSEAICQIHGWQRNGVRFYTGTPSVSEDPMWHAYWSNRLLAMRRAGIIVTHRPIRYQTEIIELPDGTTKTVMTAHEKGIDVRLALDVVRLARQGQMELAIIFSQDNDLAEIATEVRDISASQDRWLKVVSALPSSPTSTASRGIDQTDWFRMDRKFYDACIDPRDYRPAKPAQT